MIISHQNKYIFIKSRKTAGTSIEIALSQFCGSEDVITAIKNRIVVDYVGKYEMLEEDLKTISQTLELPVFSLPSAKGYSRKHHQHYSQVLNDKSRYYIEKTCAKEIEKFNYYWVNK